MHTHIHIIIYFHTHVHVPDVDHCLMKIYFCYLYFSAFSFLLNKILMEIHHVIWFNLFFQTFSIVFHGLNILTFNHSFANSYITFVLSLSYTQSLISILLQKFLYITSILGDGFSGMKLRKQRIILFIIFVYVVRLIFQKISNNSHFYH